MFQGDNECHTIDTNIGVEGHLGKIKETYLNSIFQEHTLKNWLWDALKELKIRTFNEDGNEKVVL